MEKMSGATAIVFELSMAPEATGAAAIVFEFLMAPEATGAAVEAGFESCGTATETDILLTPMIAVAILFLGLEAPPSLA